MFRPQPVQPQRLRLDLRRRIVNLKRLGRSTRSIVQTLEEEENLIVSRQTVNSVVRKFRERGTVNDLPRPGGPRKCDVIHFNFIDDQMYANRELTSQELTRRFCQEFPDIAISVSTIKRIRQKLGWRRVQTRYAQLVREVNRPIRLEWCLRMMTTNERFDDVIFTDESKVEIQQYMTTCYRKEGEPVEKRSKVKHPFSVLVWAGISRKGATNIAIFNGIMNSEGYQRILNEYFLPFVEREYPDGHRLFQDNDPKHVSRSTKAWFAENGVNHWQSPAESPDLNPIENIWGSMKAYLRKNIKPARKEELIGGIKEFWATVTPEKCNRYIRHIYKVMPAVIARGGRASGF